MNPLWEIFTSFSLKLTAVGHLPVVVPGPKRKERRKSSNHPFSGAFAVLGRVMVIYPFTTVKSIKPLKNSQKWRCDLCCLMGFLIDFCVHLRSFSVAQSRAISWFSSSGGRALFETNATTSPAGWKVTPSPFGGPYGGPGEIRGDGKSFFLFLPSDLSNRKTTKSCEQWKKDPRLFRV